LNLKQKHTVVKMDIIESETETHSCENGYH